MRITVFGATGGTGQEVVRRALERGHSVTAFVRRPDRLPIEHEHLRVVAGDALDPQPVSVAVKGQDAVVVALGSRDRRATDIRSQGTANVIQAMESQRVQRLVVVSAAGAGDSFRQMPIFFKLLVRTLLRSTYVDHEQQEEYVRRSDLEWVIVRPAMLTDKPPIGDYHTGTADADMPGGEVSRADLANFILEQLNSDHYLHQAVTIA